MLHPITFSIPSEKLAKLDNIKTKMLSNLIPGNLSTYIYNTEQGYYAEYKNSYFAITKCKGGWDCLRHYEILCNGAVPYFIDIEKCPVNTLSLCPKELFIEANNLYDKLKSKKILELTAEENNKYFNLRDKLFEYTKENLTTDKIAKYILHKSKFSNINKVLYLSATTEPDYLRCITLHGFKKILGTNCHDFPKIPHIYKSHFIDYNKLYGKGFSYTNLLDQSLHDDNLDKTIENDIKNNYYDIIIYGSYHRGMPYYDLACKVYKSNQIILLCGEDIHNCDHDDYVKKGHIVFVREL